jgi:hypothetical protein
MADIETMLRQQMQQTLTNQLDTATQAGDIAAVRKTAQQIAELAAATAQPAKKPAFTNDDIKKSIKAKAEWFGTDPRRSAKVVEFGKNMEPESFATADAFADAVIKAVDEEFKTVKAEETDDDDLDNDEPKEEEEKPAARKKTDAPSGDTGRSIVRAKTSGPWAKLSDAPKEVADQIRTFADKSTRNATKEAKEKFITTALATAYAAAQRKK